MLRITKDNLNDIENQMYNKARDIDVARYNTVLDQNPREFLTIALSAYQNKDGGFGHQLHIDNQNINSTVYQTVYALDLLYKARFNVSEKEDEIYLQIVSKAFNYLYNRVSVWSVDDKSNDDFACNSKFKYNGMKEDLGLTLLITSYTLVMLEETKAFYKKALKKVETLLNRLSEALSFSTLYGFKRLFEALNYKNINYDKKAYENYLSHLNEYASNLKIDNYNYEELPLLFEEANDKVNESLNLIIKDRRSHGLWEVSYEWDTNYPEKESAKLKWLGAKSRDMVYVLNKFNRIDK